MPPETTQPPAAAPRVCQPLIVIAASFAIGICLDRYAPPAASARAVAWWTAGGLTLAAWWILARYGQSSRMRHVTPLILCAGIAAAGAAWHHAAWNLFASDEIGRYAVDHPRPTCIEAVALETPRRLPPIAASPYRAIPAGPRSVLRIDVTGIRRGRTWLPASGNARLLVSGHLMGVHAGDRLRVFAQIDAPSAPRNPGEFDYAAHARADRRLAEFRSGFPECVEVVTAGAWYRPGRWLDHIQSYSSQLLQEQLDPANAPIAAALVLGIREGVPRDELDAFQATGTIHVLVVSGLHVGILAGVAYTLFGCFLPTRGRALVTTGCAVVVFALVTGAAPSVVRAMVGALAVLIAAGTGRRVASFNVLAGAVLVVLVLNPCDLFRIGPQLSFLAAATLIRYGQWVHARREQQSPLEQMVRYSKPLPRRLLDDAVRWMGHALALGTCIWLVALPLIVSNFHRVSPVAVLLSPFVCAIAWWSLVSGFALVAVAGILPVASGPVAALCGGTIWLLRKSVALGESLPGAHFSVAGPPMWWTLGAYAGAAGMLLVGGRIPMRWKLALLSLWIAAGLGASTLRRPDEAALRCTFVSVGHGACIVLQLPDGRTVLYDAGSLGSPEIATDSISSFLWSEGITRIEGLILSHADIDHFNAVPGLVDRFAVGGVFASPVMFDPIFHPDQASAPRQLERVLDALGIPVQTTYSGDRLRLGPRVTAEVLHPPRAGLIASDNANSIVLAVEYAQRRILLTGDLESPGMEDVLAELPYDVDVLLAPHHGSRFSDPPGLAQWCTPEWVVISGGDAEESAEAAQTYQAAGADVLHTSEMNAVQFHISRDGITVRHWIGHDWADVRGR